MDTIDKSVGDPVAVGKKIGTSGSTGNAKGMTTINKGAHLHFEVHTIGGRLGTGLDNRINPLPFINGLSK